jgi:ribonuclease Y
MSLFAKLSQVFRPKEAQTKRPSTPQPKPDRSKIKPPVAPKWGSLQSRPLITPLEPAVKVVPDAMLREAQAKAREIILEAKDEALKIREQAEDNTRNQQQKFSNLQREFDRKTNEVDRKEAVLNEKERFLDRLDKEAKDGKEEVEKLKARLIEKLEEVASLTREEAREQILRAIEKRSAKDIARIIKEAEEKAKEEADDKAREILLDAMKHGATDYVAEYAVSTVELPSEDIKGRLIGKEGRNIRAFERATGVDLDLDETPGAVRLSSFDSVRREIARQALKKLITDGRIQPARIEEYVDRAKQDIEKVMFEEGKKLCVAVGAYNVPSELISYLGRFKYRSSYGQNMIAHTLEETKIGIALAQEVGADVDTVRLGCLLHDIGKVITDEEGSHVDLGVKLLKKNGISQKVVDAVAQHHEDAAFTSNEAIIVYIADAISGARPGARYENYDEYVKRLENLENIAKANQGVTEAYAIQAGRELRVIVNHKELTDDEAVVLAEKIRDKIKSDMTYPGTVTVNVIRELRATAVAT